jgi:hypothetical protein
LRILGVNHSTDYVFKRLIEKYPDLVNEVLDMQEREAEKFKEHLVKQATAMIAPHILSTVVPSVHDLDITAIAKQYLS